MSNPMTDIVEPRPLTGWPLALGGLVLALANFLVVLDTTIANVAVPHIAGGLAVSPAQGTYVITSYAVAEAVSVPLTGWLAGRFGMVRTFIFAMIGFGVFSALCGLAPSLGLLCMFRVFQGLFGGPMMPLSQTLMLKIFPPKQQPMALGLWSMTTLVAPIAGPVLGGVLCDNVGWPSIFYINVPIAMGFSFLGWRVLRSQESGVIKSKIDSVGLALLVVWVGALQLMVDEGKDLDWFNSSTIVILGLTALIGFVAFLIWELTAENPIVPLKVFRHRGYAVSIVTLCIAIAGMYGGLVLTPLWLQNYMGYTATWSGYATAMMGVLAVFAAPLAAQLAAKVDPRKLVFMGVMWMGAMFFVRGQSTTGMDFGQVALPILFMGVGMPFFFVPLMGMALSSVDPEETAGAAGLMNFARTLSGAVAISITTTAWENGATSSRAELVTQLNPSALPSEFGIGTLDGLVQNQAVMLSTNSTFLSVASLFAIAALAVWMAPRPKRVADMSAAH
ncbi:MAG TPA: DHA2 family efflux MFS transporter permease subunit [Caulobacteraceae bacterium]|jgi:DHA2 family multidrug resistance protein|nr:DHA2 family efflux MFS transporter permease subunit [Caulobacteraceae bacterium]